MSDLADRIHDLAAGNYVTDDELEEVFSAIKDFEELDTRWRPIASRPSDGKIVEMLVLTDFDNERSVFRHSYNNKKDNLYNVIAWRPAHPDWNKQ